MAFDVTRARSISFNLKVGALFGVKKAGAAAIHGIVRHGSKVDEEAQLITSKNVFQVHAFSVRLAEKPADVLPHVYTLDAVVVNSVEGTIIAYFGDVRVDVFCTARVDLNKEQ